MKRELIYEDKRYKDVKVWKITENDGSVWVKYKRFPDIKYEYLEEGEAEFMILNGKDIRGYYIPSLTREGFEKAIAKLLTKDYTISSAEEDGLIYVINFRLGDGRSNVARYKVNDLISITTRITVKECIIGRVDLKGLNIGERHGISLDFSFSKKDKVPNEFLKECFFNGAIFRGSVDFSTSCFISNVLFNNTIYLGEATFIGVYFRDEVYLEKSVFFRNAVFSSTIFKDEVKLNNLTFQKSAFFMYSAFLANTDFSKTKINGQAHFESTFFFKDLKFNDSLFLSRTYFDRSQFCCNSIFDETTFKSKCSFNNSVLNYASFRRSNFEETAEMENISGYKIDLSNAVFKQSVFLMGENWKESFDELIKRFNKFIKDKKKEYYRENSSSNLHKIIDERVSLVKSKIEEVFKEFRYEQLELERPIGEIFLENILVRGEFRCKFDHLRPLDKKNAVLGSHSEVIKYMREDEINKLSKDEVESRDSLRDFDNTFRKNKMIKWEKAYRDYNWLREKYRKQGSSDFEDEVYFWASVCRTKNLVYEKKAKYEKIIHLKNILNLVKRTISIIWVNIHRAISRIVFGYGVKGHTTFFTIFSIIIFFSVINFIGCRNDCIYLNLKSLKYEPIISQIYNSIYFSIITFATVGYGDIQPRGWLKAFTMIEGLIGVFLIAAFVVVLFRKIVR